MHGEGMVQGCKSGLHVVGVQVGVHRCDFVVETWNMFRQL